MKVLISGQAGIAIIVRDNDLLVLKHSLPNEERPYPKLSLHYLLADATDVLEDDLPKEEIINKLELEWEKDRALQLLLILLDPDKGEEIRKITIIPLQNLLCKEEILKFVTNRLYSAPLPLNTDLDGAINYVSSEHMLNYLHELKYYQRQIRRYHYAWNILPLELFENDEKKEEFNEQIITCGILTKLVEAGTDPIRFEKVRKNIYEDLDSRLNLKKILDNLFYPNVDNVSVLSFIRTLSLKDLEEWLKQILYERIPKPLIVPPQVPFTSFVIDFLNKCLSNQPMKDNDVFCKNMRVVIRNLISNLDKEMSSHYLENLLIFCKEFKCIEAKEDIINMINGNKLIGQHNEIVLRNCCIQVLAKIDPTSHETDIFKIFIRKPDYIVSCIHALCPSSLKLLYKYFAEFQLANFEDKDIIKIVKEIIYTTDIKQLEDILDLLYCTCGICISVDEDMKDSQTYGVVKRCPAKTDKKSNKLLKINLKYLRSKPRRIGTITTYFLNIMDIECVNIMCESMCHARGQIVS